MTRQTAIEHISTYFDEGRFQADLADLVAYETESQNPDQAPELTVSDAGDDPTAD